MITDDQYLAQYCLINNDKYLERFKEQINYLNDIKRDINKFKTGCEHLADINRMIKRYEAKVKEVSGV